MEFSNVAFLYAGFCNNKTKDKPWPMFLQYGQRGRVEKCALVPFNPMFVPLGVNV